MFGQLPEGRWYGILVVPQRARGAQDPALCFRQLGGEGFTFKGHTNLFPGPGHLGSFRSISGEASQPANQFEKLLECLERKPARRENHTGTMN